MMCDGALTEVDDDVDVVESGVGGEVGDKRRMKIRVAMRVVRVTMGMRY